MLTALLSALALAGAGLQEADTPEAPPAQDETRETGETGPAPEEISAETLEAYIDGLAAAYLANDPIPGLVVSVVREGETVLAKGYGVSDIEADTPASGTEVRFEIGSISKTFIWTAVMMLAEEGRLALDEDVNTYLETYQVPEGERPLTLADLMSHRPGLEDTLSLFLPQFAELDRPEALAAIEPAQVFARGETTSYSNWGSALAAQVVEDVSGSDYADFLYQAILLPLGMNDTTYREADRGAGQPPLSRSYHAEKGWVEQTERIDIGAFGPAGSLASTAADMARWMRFHLGEGELDGVRLMSRESYRRMRERVFPDRPEAADLAHGMMERPYRGLSVFGHGGSINDFLSIMALSEELQAGVFVSQNSTASADPVQRLPDRVFDRLIAESGWPEPAPAVVEDAETRAEAAAGRYLSNRRAYSGLEKLFAGTALTSVQAEGAAIIVSTPAGSARFWPVGPDVYENRLGERVQFLRNEEGEIFRMAGTMGVHTHDRVGPASDPLLLFAAMGAAVFFSLTTWLGLWRRLGRGQTVTGLGRALSLLDLAIAGLVFAFAGILGAAVAALSNFSMATLADYPPDPLPLFMLTGTLLTLAAGLAALATVPVWAGSGWSIWRKLHHTLFALALVWLGAELVVWGVGFGHHAAS